MNFRPPYWYHDNIKFNQEQLKQLESEVKLLGSAQRSSAEKDSESNTHLTTYFLPEKERPEKIFNKTYHTIVEDITKKIGIYHRIAYTYTYWSQLYEKGMAHKAHHHALVSAISWVHFINVPKQKCFRFTDTVGNTLVPKEQKNGDIICFPSWLWHEVLPNEEAGNTRIVVAGNITINHYD